MHSESAELSEAVRGVFRRHQEGTVGEDFSTQKILLAAMGCLEQELRRRLQQEGALYRSDVDPAVQDAKLRLRELWADEAGFGMGALGPLGRDLKAVLPPRP